MKRRAEVPLWLLAAGAFVLFVPSLSGGLTNWDDPDYVTNNWLAAEGWRGALDAFRFTFDGAWYPLTQATYSVVHALGGGAGALHLLQAVLFALTVALVPLALASFGVRREVGLWVALLWAAHPFRPESVSWAANLKDTLGALFLVAAFALARRPGWSLVALAAGLLSKSAFFGLALLFPLLPRPSSAEAPTGLARLRGGLHVGLGLAIAVVAGRLHLDGKVVLAASSSLAERVATAAWTPWWYLGRTLFPLGPRALYDFAPVHPGDGRFFFALFAWAGLAVACWRWRRLVLPTLAVLFALAPVSGLVPLRHLVADRYTLFPSLALFAVLAVGAFERLPRHAGRIFAVLVVVLVPLSVLRQREWRDGRSLWEANVRLEPAVAAVRMNLAEAYGAAGLLDAARTQTLELWKLRPDDPRGWRRRCGCRGSSTARRQRCSRPGRRRSSAAGCLPTRCSTWPISAWRPTTSTRPRCCCATRRRCRATPARCAWARWWHVANAASPTRSPSRSRRWAPVTSARAWSWPSPWWTVGGSTKRCG